MKTKKVRQFRPVGKFVTGTTIPRSVARWIWVPKGGLYVETKAGSVFRSEYTLRELTQGGGWREGGIVEIVP